MGQGKQGDLRVGGVKVKKVKRYLGTLKKKKIFNYNVRGILVYLVPDIHLKCSFVVVTTGTFGNII
jgi:hypothetical protein